ncbi:MFS transporter [Actinoplanes couchii]
MLRPPVLACFVLLGIEMGIWGSRIPEVRLQTGLSYGTLGIALFALPLATVLSLAFVSNAVIRHGSCAVLRVAVLAAPVSLIPVGFARGLAMLALVLLLFGSALCLLNIAMNACAVDVEKTHQRPLMSSFHAAFSIGAIAGAGVGGVFAKLQWTPATSFTVTGIALFVAGLALARALGVDEATDPGADDPAAPATDPNPAGIRRRDLHRAVLLLGTLAMFSAAAEGAMTDWSVVYLHDALNAATGPASWGLTCFSAAVAAGRLAGNRLSARWGTVRLIQIGAAVAGSGLAAGVLSDTVPGMYLGLVLMGLGVSCVVPQIVSAAGHAPVGHPSRNIAVVTGLSTVGSLAGPVVIGAVAAAGGLTVAVTVPAALMLAVAAGGALIGDRSVQRPNKL